MMDMTMGIAEVARLSARVFGVPWVIMTSGLRRTSSAASSGMRWYRFPRRLRLSGERRGEEADRDARDERPPVDHSIT
jgi:hypothetical protein